MPIWVEAALGLAAIALCAVDKLMAPDPFTEDVGDEKI